MVTGLKGMRGLIGWRLGEARAGSDDETRRAPL